MSELTRGRRLLVVAGVATLATLAAFGFLVGVAIDGRMTAFDVFGVAISTTPLSMAGFSLGLGVVALGALFAVAETASRLEAQ